MTQPFANHEILTGNNAEYIAHLFGEYLKNPSGVDQSWATFFSELNDDELSLLAELNGASWTPAENSKKGPAFGVVPAEEVSKSAANTNKHATPAADANAVRQAAHDSIRALQLIRAYRSRGHMIADLDPLGLKEIEHHPELDPAHYGFSSSDMNRDIYIGGLLGTEHATLTQIITKLKGIYCNKIGVEFVHMTDPEQKQWLQKRIENTGNWTAFSVKEKKKILKDLARAESFEQYLHKKHPGTKRFGVDGGESLIPMIEEILSQGAKNGLEEVVIGMAHRGRLNVLANIMSKPYTNIFAEFQGYSSMPDNVLGSGDVKYHLGTSSDREFEGKRIHLSLTANPSHLEFVNPVVIGKVRAKQMMRGESQSVSVMPMLLHGDAAFAGQGITAETLMISELQGYRVGGTMHIVINNQIGFTTMPKYSRSGPYCTDVAKMLAAPIFHVNGDDPEAVCHIARIATEFRQKFQKDVVIDMYCYRRFGHNEGDEPAFTQPIMYQKIATQHTTREQYAERLIAEGTLTQQEADKKLADFNAELDEAFEATKEFSGVQADYLEGAWQGFKAADPGPRRGKTAVDKNEILTIGKHLTTPPAGFDINKKLQRVLNAKTEMLTSGEGFDWATAEALAFGTLLDDGFRVRISGQDVGRGTFSQRHAIWYDQTTGEKYIPLRTLAANQPRFEAHDSPLSEAAVLGFEYGVSLADPKTLTIWEAQFGDFVNGAQVLIDQFIASGESKWVRMSGLVMLLPHGYEGQGPEHSSARFERFLQLCGEDNWQVANCTTPANYFHVLRRQMVRDFRKPLVVMTPKSLLRHKLAQSSLEDFIGDSTFHRVLWDTDAEKLVKADKIKRVVLCTGKVYYDLLEERRERNIDNVYIMRLEQLYPFPFDALAEELAAFKNAEIVWCQEEPENQGAWTFVDRQIEAVLSEVGHKSSRPVYVGRPPTASPATGFLERHRAEQAKLVIEAVTV